MVSLFDKHLITILIFSPVFWAICCLFFNKKNTQLLRVFSIIASSVTFLLSCLLWKRFDIHSADIQLAERIEWMPDFGISYFVGIDGLSLLLVLLSTFLVPIIFLSSWNYISSKVKAYTALFFLLEAGMIGAFVSLDVFLFYIFWEAMLVPMFFIVGVWGGPKRIYAASKFMLYTIAGSLPMLIAIIYLIWQYKSQFGVFSASIIDLYQVSMPMDGFFSAQSLVFWAFCLAFAIKVPMFPLHTWLPDAHVQAPTGGSVILAGVLLKLGIYGFMRFAVPVAAEAALVYSDFFLVISVFAIIYGACVAFVQTDIKKLVAYSSVSHMGYIVLGLFSFNQIGVTGSIYQMLSHGISTGTLFLLVGILYERYHTREISVFGGLAKLLPLYTIVMVIATMSSIALPGTNGFIGEFMILQGAFLANWPVAIAGGAGVVLGAVYMLWLCQRILFGKLKTPDEKVRLDLNMREVAYLAPMIASIFIMGIYPRPFIQRMEKSVDYFVTNGLSADYSLNVQYVSDLRSGSGKKSSIVKR